MAETTATQTTMIAFEIKVVLCMRHKVKVSDSYLSGLLRLIEDQSEIQNSAMKDQGFKLDLFLYFKEELNRVVFGYNRNFRRNHWFWQQ